MLFGSLQSIHIEGSTGSTYMWLECAIIIFLWVVRQYAIVQIGSRL